MNTASLDFLGGFTRSLFKNFKQYNEEGIHLETGIQIEKVLWTSQFKITPFSAYKKVIVVVN